MFTEHLGPTELAEIISVLQTQRMTISQHVETLKASPHLYRQELTLLDEKLHELDKEIEKRIDQMLERMGDG